MFISFAFGMTMPDKNHQVDRDLQLHDELTVLADKFSVMEFDLNPFMLNEIVNQMCSLHGQR